MANADAATTATPTRMDQTAFDDITGADGMECLPAEPASAHVQGSTLDTTGGLASVLYSALPYPLPNLLMCLMMLYEHMPHTHCGERRSFIAVLTTLLHGMTICSEFFNSLPMATCSAYISHPARGIIRCRCTEIAATCASIGMHGKQPDSTCQSPATCRGGT